MPSSSSTARSHSPTDWHAQELLLMREVMRLIGRSLAPGLVLREMLHLMSELLGLNRGRIVLADPVAARADAVVRTASIVHAYGLTREEVARGRYAWGEGITGRVLASGLPAIVQDIDDEPLFLARAVARDQLPPETVAFIALPIEINAVPVGVLACHRLRSRQQFVAVLPEFVARVVQQHPDQLEQAHSTTSSFSCRFGCTAYVVVLRCPNRSAGLSPLQPLPKVKPQPPRSPKVSLAYSRCALGITKRSS